MRTLAVFLLITLGAIGSMMVSGELHANGSDFTVSLANDDDVDGTLIEVADTLLDWDLVDVGEGYSISVPSGGWFVSKYAVINPDPKPVLPHGRIDLPTNTSTLTAVLWEDVDDDGLYGEGVDNVLDSDTTDSNGYYSMEYPNNFDGSAGILIYLGDEFENGDTITGCVGCSG